MKKTLLFILSIFLITPILKGQEIKRVENAVNLLVSALISGRQTDLEYIANDSLSYGHSSGKIETKKDFVNTLVTHESDFLTIDITNQSIHIYGDIAIVRHNLLAKINDNGKPGEIYLKIILVFTKRYGCDWTLLARQAYK